MNYLEITKFSNVFYSLAQGRHPLAEISYDIVDNIGGLVNAKYLREGMRDISGIRETFKDKSPKEAEDIATGMVPYSIDPIKVAIEELPNGNYNVNVIDGRHRATAAREAGAELIQAIVYYTITKSHEEYEDLEPFKTVLPLGKNVEKLVQKDNDFKLERIDEVTSF